SGGGGAPTDGRSATSDAHDPGSDHTGDPGHDTGHDPIVDPGHEGGDGLDPDADPMLVDPFELGFSITLQQAYAVWLQGITFIDARPRDEYDAGHIPGAFSLDANDAQALFLDMRDMFGLDDPIVIYCQGGECHDSEYVAEMFVGDGYTGIHVFRGGYEAWTAAELETDDADPLGEGG
ncbi:MAG: rhodanese-like domain-containing protein, partial [Phycisphaerales bacterium]|nr:rhodanese-like domain-containing protein [Phycisphaerales bacterium]